MFCEFCGNTVTAGASTCAACTTTTPAPATGELGARAAKASRDGLETLKRSLADPVGNVGALYELFGAKRALDAGIALAVAFDLAVVAAVQIGARKTLGFLTPLVFGNSSLMSFLKSMILAAVPALTLTAVLLLLQRVLTGKTDVARAAFVAGITLAPFALAALLSAILGAANFEIVALLVVMQVSYTILILFGGCRDVLGVASGRAAAVVPAIFIATGWLSKVVIVAML
jgi:hypothetical protein